MLRCIGPAPFSWCAPRHCLASLSLAPLWRGYTAVISVNVRAQPSPLGNGAVEHASSRTRASEALRGSRWSPAWLAPQPLKQAVLQPRSRCAGRRRRHSSVLVSAASLAIDAPVFAFSLRGAGQGRAAGRRRCGACPPRALPRVRSLHGREGGVLVGRGARRARRATVLTLFCLPGGRWGRGRIWVEQQRQQVLPGEGLAEANRLVAGLELPRRSWSTMNSTSGMLRRYPGPGEGKAAARRRACRGRCLRAPLRGWEPGVQGLLTAHFPHPHDSHACTHGRTHGRGRKHGCGNGSGCASPRFGSGSMWTRWTRRYGGGAGARSFWVGWGRRAG